MQQCAPPWNVLCPGFKVISCTKEVGCLLKDASGSGLYLAGLRLPAPLPRWCKVPTPVASATPGPKWHMPLRWEPTPWLQCPHLPNLCLTAVGAMPAATLCHIPMSPMYVAVGLNWGRWTSIVVRAFQDGREASDHARSAWNSMVSFIQCSRFLAFVE